VEIMATVRDALGCEPITLIVTDDTGRVLTPYTWRTGNSGSSGDEHA
jgi:hypothetical protein